VALPELPNIGLLPVDTPPHVLPRFFDALRLHGSDTTAPAIAACDATSCLFRSLDLQQPDKSHDYPSRAWRWTYMTIVRPQLKAVFHVGPRHRRTLVPGETWPLGTS